MSSGSEVSTATSGEPAKGQHVLASCTFRRAQELKMVFTFENVNCKMSKGLLALQ